MKLIFLLVLVGLATASNLQLGDRIIAAEQECDRIHKLNDNWSTSNFHEEAVQYVDLYFICRDSLNEAKYAYIDENLVDLSWYPGEDGKFPIFTTEGVKYVTKPPPRKPKDVKTMKKRLGEYIRNAGGKMNPLYRLMSIQSEMSQAIIDKQVECEVLALYMLKHPDDKESDAKHTACMTKLNCIKERFMDQHKFTREQYPKYFPILYKKRGTMVKTPPKIEESVCETPDSPEGNKKELEKWISGIEFVGGKLLDFGEVGTDFIGKLAKKGMNGGDKLLTKEELDDIITDEQSTTPSDDDKNYAQAEGNPAKVNGGATMAKLAGLKNKGVEIAQAQLNRAKPAVGQAINIASTTGERLKILEEEKLKPAIQKTAQGLSNVNFKDTSKIAFEGVRDGLATAGSFAKSKLKEGSFTLIDKMMKKSREDKDGEATGISDEHEQDHEITSDPSQGWLSNLIERMVHPEYLPNNYDGTKPPSLIKVLTEMGGHDEEGKEKISDDELKQMLKSLKGTTKKRAHELHLNKDQVRKSAEVVKGVMNALLYAARRGQGPAKNMKQQEINAAEPLVEELVDYAVAELINDGSKHGEDEDEEGEDEDGKDESRKDEGGKDEGGKDEGGKDEGGKDVRGNDEDEDKVAPDGECEEVEKPGSATDQVPSEDNNTTPTAMKKPSQTATDAVKHVEKQESGNESEGSGTSEDSNRNKEEPVITEKKQAVLDIK